MNMIMDRARQYMDSLVQGIDPLSGTPAPEDAALHQEMLVNCLRYTGGFLQRELDQQAQPQEEHRLMKRALMYMEMLSQGKNPVGGDALPAGSVLNNKKLAACFRYVALVYRQALEPPRVDPVAPMTPELRERVQYSQEPVALSTLGRQLDDLLGYKVFMRQFISEWLVREGLIALEEENGKMTQVATERGIAAGISKQAHERTEGESGTYYGIVYDEKVQHLIVDHLDQVMSVAMEYWDGILDCLTPEFCIRFPCSTEPISTSDLVKRIEARLPSRKKLYLSGTRLIRCLEKKGLFIEQKGHMYPTQQGRELGIGFNGRNSTGKQGVSWTESAQQYLVDHLREIVLDLRTGEGYRAASPV